MQLVILILLVILGIKYVKERRALYNFNRDPGYDEKNQPTTRLYDGN